MSKAEFELPAEMLDRLDKVSARTHRPRSEIVAAAIERHLTTVGETIEDGSRQDIEQKLALLRSFAGAGIGPNGPRNPDEIVSDIRWLRGDD